MKKILVVVDMQNDFITGPLGTPEAVSIVDNVVEKIRGESWDYIYTTQDTHEENYSYTQEGKKLPVKHCIDCDEGWLLNPNVFRALRDVMVKDFNEENERGVWGGLQKSTFGCLELVNYLGEDYVWKACMTDADIELTLVGVCTDICVISNALLLKAHYPEMKIMVDASCCAGSSPFRHREALDIMRSCQVEIVNDPVEDIVEYAKAALNDVYGLLADLLEKESEE